MYAHIYKVLLSQCMLWYVDWFFMKRILFYGIKIYILLLALIMKNNQLGVVCRLCIGGFLPALLPRQYLICFVNQPAFARKLFNFKGTVSRNLIQESTDASGCWCFPFLWLGTPVQFRNIVLSTLGKICTVKSGNVGNGVWFGNGTSIHIIPTGYLINWFSEKC